MNIIQHIIYLFAEFLTCLLMIFSVSNIYTNKLNLNFKKIILIFLSSELIILNNLFNFNSIKIVVTFIISLLLIKIAYKISIKESIKGTIIYTIISMAIEIILLIIVLIFNQNTLDLLNTNTIIKTLFSTLESLITLAVLKDVRIIKIFNKIEYILKDKNNIKLLSLISVLVLSFVLVLLSNSFNNIKILLLSIICSLLLIAILKLYINSNYNIKILSERNKNLKESYRAYSCIVDEYRIMKHNLTNELLSIKTTLPSKYQNNIDILLKKYNNSTNWVTTINDIPEGLQGLVFLKQKEAEKNKIKFYINIDNKIKENNNYIELCNIISILLDNAIEATKNVKDKVIMINIINNKNSIEIDIRNIFNNIIDLNKIGTKNYSTKKVKSGLGLNYLKSLKSNRIKFKISIINNLFIVKVNYSK